MKYTYSVQILEHHLDSFGHVNNAVYMQLFEQARWDFITEKDFGSRQIFERRKGPVILEANIKYKKELTNREQIKIESTIMQTDNPLIFGIHQEMLNGEGKLACVGDFTGGLMDLDARKLIKPTAEWMVILGNKKT